MRLTVSLVYLRPIDQDSTTLKTTLHGSSRQGPCPWPRLAQPLRRPFRFAPSTRSQGAASRMCALSDVSRCVLRLGSSMAVLSSAAGRRFGHSAGLQALVAQSNACLHYAGGPGQPTAVRAPLACHCQRATLQCKRLCRGLQMQPTQLTKAPRRPSGIQVARSRFRTAAALALWQARAAPSRCAQR